MRQVKNFSRNDLIADDEDKRDNAPKANFTGPFTNAI